MSSTLDVHRLSAASRKFCKSKEVIMSSIFSPLFRWIFAYSGDEIFVRQCDQVSLIYSVLDANGRMSWWAKKGD